jgi:hypothetical protein
MSLTKATFSMISGASVNVQDFGAVGDGVTDDYQAIRNAIDSLPPLGGTLWFPYTDSGGVYYLSETLNISRPIRMTGQIISSSTSYFYIGTVLKFAASKTGITFNAYNSAAGELAYGASYSAMENIGVASFGGSGDFDGILIRAVGIQLKNVWSFSFPRNGVRIYATIGGGGEIEGNANLWKIDNMYCALNGSHGLYVAGADGNAGLANSVNCSINGGYGIFDESFLGNTYVACHVDNNSLGAYKTTGGVSYNTFIGCYTEPTQGIKSISSLVFPTVVFGGTMAGDDVITVASTAFILGAGNSYRRPIRQYNSSGASLVTSALGENDTTLTAFTWGCSPEPENAWKLKFDNTNYAWKIQFANSTSFEPIRYINSTSTLYTGKGLTGPVFQNGYGVRNATDAGGVAKVRLLGTAAPSSGTYEVGDIVYNSAPVAGGTIGFVCTTAGTPGTWKTFGAIAA